MNPAGKKRSHKNKLAATTSSTQKTGKKNYLLPVIITTVGIGTLALTIYLLYRKTQQIIEEANYDVENYDVVLGKPLINYRHFRQHQYMQS